MEMLISPYAKSNEVKSLELLSELKTAVRGSEDH